MDDAIYNVNPLFCRASKTFSKPQLLKKLAELKDKYFRDRVAEESLHQPLSDRPSNRQVLKRLQRNLTYRLQTVDDLYEILESLKIDDELYIKFATIRGYYLIMIAFGWKITNAANYTRDSLSYICKCKTLLEPFKNRPEGIWLYMKCSLLEGDVYNKQGNIVKEATTYELALDTYDEYVKQENVEQAWNLNNIFAHHDTVGDGSLNEDRDTINYQLLRAGMILDRISHFEIADRVLLKHGLHALDLMLKENKETVKLIFSLYKIATIFLFSKHYPQANHLLAIAMVKSVEHRRSLPAAEQSTMNELQSMVSLAFSKYGSCYILDSFALKAGQVVEIRTDCMRLMDGVGSIVNFYTGCKRLMDAEGLELYEKEFPTDLTTDDTVLRLALDKTKSWLKEGIDMHSSAVFAKEIIEAIKVAERQLN